MRPCWLLGGGTRVARARGRPTRTGRGALLYLSLGSFPAQAKTAYPYRRPNGSTDRWPLPTGRSILIVVTIAIGLAPHRNCNTRQPRTQKGVPPPPRHNPYSHTLLTTKAESRSHNRTGRRARARAAEAGRRAHAGPAGPSARAVPAGNHPLSGACQISNAQSTEYVLINPNAIMHLSMQSVGKSMHSMQSVGKKYA